MPQDAIRELPPCVLAIAGSDSGGGAGIEADIKTITARGGFGMAAITALTAQNTLGVAGVYEIPPQFVARQIDAVAEDIGVDVAKTGMLCGAATVEVVADCIRRHSITRLVVDPVMVAKSGAPLLKPDAVSALRQKLLPLALVVTPNLREAAALAEMEVTTLEEMRRAAQRIAKLGPRWVLVKGGHLPGDPVDLLFDGREFIELARPRVPTENTHGTGCTYASALATYIGWGLSVPEAAESARDAVQTGLENSLALGRGHGPLDHHAMFRPPPAGRS